MCGGSFGTRSSVFTIRHESMGSRPNNRANSLLPTRGDANVHSVATSNFCFVEFSMTNKVVNAPPRLCPVTTVGRGWRSRPVTAGASPRVASLLLAS